MKLDDFNQLQEQQIKSGLTQAEFCRKNNLKASMFSYWKRKFHKPKRLDLKASPTRFIEIPAQLDDSFFELRFNNGKSLKIPQNFDSNSLSSVLAIVEAL